ncbi:MAG: helix-turn-helix domain-containing protein [Rhodospirillum sp.]|nr:helix-turn-helix domain-containing protein [Rhodospirillum sp.]MCF8489656.1 helix-turn-helix domain-containing protein [Rhodospirillum sp.]MCF8500540.1 helix-turn-helix domain-containing protein [Rhodospirillum sp.]
MSHSLDASSATLDQGGQRPPAYQDVSGLEASQIDDILDHFLDGDSLTQDEALERYGCARLAARVWDLRQLGHPIQKRMVRDDLGRLVAEYVLSPTPGR